MSVHDYLAQYFPKTLRELGAVCLGLWLGMAASHAQQEVPRQQADHLFYAQDYPQAASRYAELLKDPLPGGRGAEGGTFQLGLRLQGNGGFCQSRKHLPGVAGNGRAHRKKPGLPTSITPKPLGQNGKLQEAQEMYGRYEGIKATLGTGPTHYRPRRHR